jgi:hypothetical protein
MSHVRRCGKMIVTRLYGGLGNQMFQYSIARAYELRTGIPFVVDTLHLLNAGVPRNYELNNFVCNPKARTAWQRIHKTIVVDERFTTPEKFNTLALDNLELVGYWQSEKYFKDYRKQICEDFERAKTLNIENAQMLEKITECENPVSVHIRRGDYVGNVLHPTMQEDYYERAFEVVESRVKNPHYFVFSDDTLATSIIHKSGITTPVAINDSIHGYLDLELMKRCKHHIIANSSFSWWGAWLCEDPDKVVVAPKRWFNGHEFQGVPDGWIRA